MKPSVELIERFHEKWQVNPDNGCWEWTASLAGKGYGQIKLPGERRQEYAHRLSYMIHYGDIAEGLVVCHTCDNAKCVKPSHLFLGTQSDNLNDMKAKDRHLCGSRNKMAKLDEDKVAAILLMLSEGMAQSKIASAFGVSQSVVYRIAHNETWTHVKRPDSSVIR